MKAEESAPWRCFADDASYSPDEVFGPPGPAKAVRGFRTREGLTQAALALRTGIPRRRISEMENSKRPIGKQNARTLAQALNVDARRFLKV